LLLLFHGYRSVGFFLQVALKITMGGRKFDGFCKLFHLLMTKRLTALELSNLITEYPDLSRKTTSDCFPRFGSTNKNLSNLRTALQLSGSLSLSLPRSFLIPVLSSAFSTFLLLLFLGALLSFSCGVAKDVEAIIEILTLTQNLILLDISGSCSFLLFSHCRSGCFFSR
jgi:hypothetical protein